MKAISWRRKLIRKQGHIGLGLSAQKYIIEYFAEKENFELVADYCEAYSGTRISGCTELRKAIEHCKRIGAVLIIAKSDRFRNTIEALQIYEEMGEGNIFFCDLPHTDKFTLTLFFALAEREALITKLRTQAALDEIKNEIATTGQHVSKRGNVITKLGRPDIGQSDIWDKALDASIATRKRKAEANENNIRFAKWLDVWESNHGTIDRHTNLDPIVDEVNALGYKTSSGMDFNKASLRQMIYRTHKRKAEQIREQQSNDEVIKFVNEQNGLSITDNLSDTSITNNPFSDPLSINQDKLKILEHETIVSQELLTNIFVDEDEQQSTVLIDKSWKSLLAILFTKESWEREDLEKQCKVQRLMLGAVLEQINDYSYEKLDDAVIEEDGDIIYVNLEYKDLLI